jgi:hypothetical protein
VVQRPRPDEHAVDIGQPQSAGEAISENAGAAEEDSTVGGAHPPQPINALGSWIGHHSRSA